MADQPTTSKSPRTASNPVRGFLNLSAALPDFGAETVKEIAAVSKGGGKGLVYGTGNTVPVIAMAAKQASPTAYRCLERRAQFLEGVGFPMPERNPVTGALLRPEEAGTMGETPVPGYPGKTANDFWAEQCSYASDNNGAAVLVRYNNGGGIGETHIVPFGAIRKTTSGTYLLNHKFGRKGYKAADTTEHLPFDNDPKIVRGILKRAKEIDPKTNKPYGQPGQIFYIYVPKSGEEDYPLPPHYPGIEALWTDAAYAEYDLSEVRTGFMAKGIIGLVGELDDTTEDAEGRTEWDKQNDELWGFTQAGSQEQGIERKSIMVMAAKSKEALPVWIPINTTVDLKWLSEKIDSVGQQVCRHIGIPPILMGFAKPGQLGATQELINAAQLTQTSLEPLRKAQLRAFWRLFPTLNGIVPGKLNPVDVAKAVQTENGVTPPTNA